MRNCRSQWSDEQLHPLNALPVTFVAWLLQFAATVRVR
jgi:hypothetical protein